MNVKIIAEIGINHQGNFGLMKDMMLKASICGVNYVKSQKRDPKTFLTKQKYNEPYISDHAFGDTYGKHKEALEFSMPQWKQLFKFAKKNGIKLFASVFDVISARNMNKLGMQIFKIGSAEVTFLGLLEEVKSYNKPIILSTGMSNLEQIDKAVDVLKGANLTLMQCTSANPCALPDVHLKVLETYKKRYKLPIGLSGHYEQGCGGIESAAVAMGATWIERHFTTSRHLKGSDQIGSLEPLGMYNIVKSVKDTVIAMGKGKKTILDCEKGIMAKCRRY